MGREAASGLGASFVPLHDGFHAFMKELNRIYLETPALWAKDYDREGFVWADCHEEEKCIYAFCARTESRSFWLYSIFSEKEQKGFELRLDPEKKEDKRKRTRKKRQKRTRAGRRKTPGRSAFPATGIFTAEREAPGKNGEGFFR